ncbi:MAG: tetratricopeptide repeat protein [Deltaproteobacteria bacterium]|nr:tetratricopeptide repeat protein [Deltaproteobacteria bacterium]
MKRDNYSSVLVDEAVILAERGGREADGSLFKEALTFKPDDIIAMNRRAMIYAEGGDHRKAVELYQRIVAQNPDNFDALLLLGVEHAQTGNYQEAVACFYRCIAMSPLHAGLHKMLGMALSDGGKHEEAMEQFRVACQIDPGDDELLTRFAIELIHFLKMAEAEERLLQALALNPANALAYNNLGRVYKFQGKATEAVKAFRTSLELDPVNHVVANNLLLTLNYLADATPEQVASEHRAYCRSVYGSENRTSRAGLMLPSKLIRIGYVSGDFHSHSVSFFFEPILMNHNGRQFQIYCYSNGVQEDETTRRLMAYNVQWKNIATISDRDAAEIIRADEIDILVDLSGHSSGNRLGLFALKPAHVQVSWIGYPHSTGLAQMDYYISDVVCDPPGMTEHLYTEKIVRLPRIFTCYLPPLQFPQVMPPPSEESAIITFGSFNNFAKVNNSVIAVWADILNRVANSRLFLKSMALGDMVTQKQVLDSFAKHGINADRIALLNTVNSPVEHLALYGQIDIALDTFPYNGTTTTCEALWMGVPVVALAGATHASRVGASLLTNVGVPELVASTHSNYVSKAMFLAGDSKRLKQYRDNLRSNMACSPLMDAAGVTAELEKAYVELYSAGNERNQTPAVRIEEARRLFSADQLEASESKFRELLKDFPLNAELHNSLATVLDRQSQYPEAVAHYTKALALHPGFLVARFNLANTLKRMGDGSGCKENLLAVIAIDPDFIEAWQNLGRIYFDEGNFQKAAYCLEMVLSIAPDRVLSWAELGDIYYRVGDENDRALSCLERAINIKPDFSSAYNSKGLILHEQGDFFGAENCYRAALALDPDDSYYMNNLGLSLLAQARPIEAIQWLDKSLAQEPESPTTRFNRATVLLLIGDCERGWVDFEGRFEKNDPVCLSSTVIPRWNGEPLTGKTIIVRMEQGYGDCIQCLRFLPQLYEAGARIIIECMDDRIKSLFMHRKDVNTLFLRGEGPPSADFQIPLFSLPLLFGTNLSNIPFPEGYIDADSSLSDFWKKRMQEIAVAGSIKVGLVWGGRKTRLGANRSLLLDDLAPLFSVPGINWYSLQVGDDVQQLQEYAGVLVNLGEEFISFADTAAAIANLDLVITIDTSVAHLCGALGVPTWVLLKSSPDWRWLLDRSDSPWYNSLTLFRQTISGQWGTVVQEVAKKLHDVIEKKLKSVDSGPIRTVNQE